MMTPTIQVTPMKNPTAWRTYTSSASSLPFFSSAISGSPFGCHDVAAAAAPSTRSQSEASPQLVDALLHRRVHRDRAAPGARGLARPLVRRIDAHLRPEAGHRTREVEVVDRRIVDDRDVAGRVDPCRQRPDHFFPVADVDVVVHHHDDLRVHELPQEAPDPEHYALRVPGILLPHARHGEAVRTTLGRQVEVGDLRK